MSSHGYLGPAIEALPSAVRLGLPTWQTEYGDISGEAFNTSYTSGTANGQQASDRVMDAMLKGTSAYFDFVGNLNEAGGYPYPNQTLIKNDSLFELHGFEAPLGLWELFAVHSSGRRSVPRRARTTPTSRSLRSGIPSNSIVVVVNSHGSSTKTTTIEGISGGNYTRYVTDNSNNLAAGGSTSVGSSGSVSVSIPANSTVTFKFTGSTLALPNFAQGASASMNATPYAGFGADKAVDGNLSTYAQANTVTPWDLTIDLGSDKSFTTVELVQAVPAQYATSYTIEVATAAAPSTWSTVYATTTGVGGRVEHDFSRTTARYVRLNVTAATGSFAHAVYELGVYDEAPNAPDVALHHAATMSSSPFSGYGADKTTDGDPATYAQAAASGPWDLTIDLLDERTSGHVTVVQSTGASYASEYQIQVATAAAPTTWVTVYSTTTSTGGTQNIGFSERDFRYVRFDAITAVGAYSPTIFQFSGVAMTTPSRAPAIQGLIEFVQANVAPSEQRQVVGERLVLKTAKGEPWSSDRATPRGFMTEFRGRPNTPAPAVLDTASVVVRTLALAARRGTHRLRRRPDVRNDQSRRRGRASRRPGRLPVRAGSSRHGRADSREAHWSTWRARGASLRHVHRRCPLDRARWPTSGYGPVRVVAISCSRSSPAGPTTSTRRRAGSGTTRGAWCSLVTRSRRVRRRRQTPTRSWPWPSACSSARGTG